MLRKTENYTTIKNSWRWLTIKNNLKATHYIWHVIQMLQTVLKNSSISIVQIVLVLFTLENERKSMRKTIDTVENLAEN